MSQAKPSPAKPARSPAASRAPRDAGPFTVGRWWRRGISLLLVFHLVLVIAVPLTIMRPSSRLATVIATWTRPWIDITQLSHGYGFFAAEPGPSHLVKCRYRFNDGRAPEPGQFPDITEQWPRLRYHRHFMLAEKLLVYFEPPDPPQPGREPNLDELQSTWIAAAWKAEQQRRAEELRQWKRRRAMYEALVRSYGQHLLAGSDADVVDVRLEEHSLPSPEAVAAGVGLNETESYFFIPGSMLEVHRAAPLSPEIESKTEPETITAPVGREAPIRVPGIGR